MKCFECQNGIVPKKSDQVEKNLVKTKQLLSYPYQVVSYSHFKSVILTASHLATYWTQMYETLNLPY